MYSDEQEAWLKRFVRRLIDLAVASGHTEKEKFARDYAWEIGRMYLADGDVTGNPSAQLPETFKDPVEAAGFEFGCWAWWPRKRDGRLELPERA